MGDILEIFIARFMENDQNTRKYQRGRHKYACEFGLVGHDWQWINLGVGFCFSNNTLSK